MPKLNPPVELQAAPGRTYNDGPLDLDTPLAVEAEKSYRSGFLSGARIASAWAVPQVEIYESFMRSRRDRKNAAVVGADHGVCLFRVGHEVEAANYRGLTQAAWSAIEDWEYFRGEGFDDSVIRSVILKDWVARVTAWAQSPIDTRGIVPPPRPSETLSIDAQEKLEEIREASVLTDPKLPASANIRPRSLRSLIGRFAEMHSPIIHGLLRVGETMNIIAPPKACKSWLASDMALAVATGRPWLDRFKTEVGDVLIIDNELHAATSAQRIPMVMSARGIDPEKVADHIFVANLRGDLRDINSLGEYFNHVIADRFKLVILDAFYRVLPSDADENDNAGMARVYNQVDRYAEMLGAAFVMIHHTSKGNQSLKSITDVGAGAGSQSRATDTHLVLRPHEEDGAIVLDAAVRSWPPLDPVCLRWHYPVWSLDESLDPSRLRVESRRRRAKTEAAEASEPEWTPERLVEAFVSEAPQQTVSIIAAAKAASLSERKATKLLKQAEADGLVHRWRIAPNRPVEFSTQPPPESFGKPSL